MTRFNRREAIGRLGGGFGGAALAALLAEESARADETGTNPKPHHAPKATAVIQLFMHGGPSHVDLLDPKPALEKYDGKPPPAEVADDEKITGNLLRSPFKFTPAGQSGTPFSEVLPGIATHADDIAVIRSMFTEHRNHEQALWMMHGGLTVAGRPALGAWAIYGLGYRAATDRCKVSDLHATIPHLMGLDHTKLTFRHHGRDERLTDVYEAKPVKAVLA